MDEDVITLTHVCRAWREVFVSRSSLWTHFDCVDGEKTRVYFERSKSSPINLSLEISEGISACNPFFQIIPHATGRLKSLFVEGPSEDLQVITPHLFHPAPLLEHLSLRCYGDTPHRRLALTSALFDGDLSSLRVLYLELVHTELPWRNMVNLTSFTLTPPGAVSVGQLLDFFESAPHLEEVKLCSATSTTGAQNGQLVSLGRLKSMYISNNPASVLLDHLLIPVGAKLKIWVELLGSLIGEHLPKSLDNLKNFSDFTTIQLHLGKYYQRMKFSGPNGQVKLILRLSRNDQTGSVFGSLVELDTSKTERLEIDSCDILSEDPVYRALLPMKDLRTLTLSECMYPHIFFRALQPATSSLEVVVCPKLEEVVVAPPIYGGRFVIAGVIEMAAGRASRGKKLKTIRIIDPWQGVDLDVSELRKHVWEVEYDPGVQL
jgi:hypothetical protein